MEERIRFVTLLRVHFGRQMPRRKETINTFEQSWREVRNRAPGLEILVVLFFTFARSLRFNFEA